jgi:L-asparaginase/Glu-tRNA(Gln) amidotransferase subunit D
MAKPLLRLARLDAQSSHLHFLLQRRSLGRSGSKKHNDLHRIVIKPTYSNAMGNPMRKPKNILVVTLGGTIESFYNPEEYTPEDVPLEASAGATVIPKAMEKLGIARGCDFYPLAMRDSKKSDLTEFDALVDHIKSHHYQRILVIEGTDRMAPHGVHLEQALKAAGLGDRQVVVTGAMGPLRDKHKQWREPTEDAQRTVSEKRDGWFNLRMAVHDLKRGIPSGVYLRMGREFWPASRITKDIELDRSGPVNTVTSSGFRALAHPDSRGQKIGR